MLPQLCDSCMHLAGMVYGLYEVLLHATVAPFLSHRFKAAMEKPDDREARLNSKLALGRVIGWTHNSIQVRYGARIGVPWSQVDVQ